MPGTRSRVRAVEMFDANDPRAAELFNQITKDVKSSKHKLMVDRRRVARFNRLLRPWKVTDGPGTGQQCPVRLVDLEPSEKDGSAEHWRGYISLPRQRKAVELDNPRVIERTLRQRLR